MLGILVYYLFLPFLGAWLVIKFIKKYGDQGPAEDIRGLLAAHPIERRWYRALRRDGAGPAALGDFEKHEEAVDCIYAAREEARRERRSAQLLVVNDTGETLDLLDV